MANEKPATPVTPPPENQSFLPAGAQPRRDTDFLPLDWEGGRYEDKGFGSLR